MTERNGRNFGDFTYIGDHADESGFFDKDSQGRALDMAWSHACVIARELTDPNNKQYGPVWMLNRYAETNFWMGYIVAIAKEKNAELAELLTETQLRKPNEVVGHYEEESIPQSHVTLLSPMSRIHGYALPRILIEWMGRRDNRKEVVQEILGEVDREIIVSASPASLLARMANSASRTGADNTILLSHLLPTGFLAEENCFDDYRRLSNVLKLYAPTVWKAYFSLTPEERVAHGIAEINLYRR